MRRRLLAHIGLIRPYRFERLIVALAAAFLLATLAAALAVLWSTGEFTPGSPRERYFLYLAGLVVAGFALAGRPALAAGALSLAIVDLALGLGSHALHKAGRLHSSLLPLQYDDPPRFAWHPLLQAVPIPSITRRVVNVGVSHSAQGTRGRDYGAEELAGKKVIAVFGGSTTYDLWSSDEDTWPARLEALLGAARVAVINHGVPGYTTVEHVIQTAFYQDKFGVPPACALYYVGWNDIHNAHLPNLDPGYADHHLRAQIDGLFVRRAGTGFSSLSPLLTLGVRLIGLAVDTARPAPAIAGPPRAGNDPALEAIFVRNVRAISAINRERGVRTVWVGQVLNRAAFRDEGVHGWIPLVRNKDVLPLLHHFNDVLRGEAAALGDAHVGLDDGLFEPADFHDNGHFVARGSLKFARLLAPAVHRECGGP
jgi:hypothetical protein